MMALSDEHQIEPRTNFQVREKIAEYIEIKGHFQTSFWTW